MSEFIVKFFLVVRLIAGIGASSIPYQSVHETGRPVNISTDCNSVIGIRRDGNFDDEGLFKEVDWFLGIPYASVKRFEDGAAFPVMVYIHGGSYYVGGGKTFIGDNLAQHGVVVVSFNYRLNILGFLSSSRPKLTGNYGLYDQVEALKWVQRFIKYFRGDPRRVTIFGNSAGGSSVGFHSLIPETKGLFSQVIMQSGSPLAFWAFNDFNDSEREFYANKVAMKLGCRHEKCDDILSCLKNVSITKKELNAIVQAIQVSPVSCEVTPVLDGDLLKQTPQNSIITFDGPLMAGVVSREFENHRSAWFNYYDILYKINIKDSGNKKKAKNVFEKSEFLISNYFRDYTKEDAKKIHAFYEIHERSPSSKYVDLLSDMFMFVPIMNFALKYQHLTKRKAYFYEFNHSISFERPGNFHEVELNLVFGYDINRGLFGDEIEVIKTGEDRNVSKYMMKLWTNFAKYGNPNGISDQVWKTLDETSKCFIITNETSSKMVENYKTKYLKFWNQMKSLKVKFPYKQTSNKAFQIKASLTYICLCLLFVFIQ